MNDAECFTLFVFAFYGDRGYDPEDLRRHYRETVGRAVPVEALVRACQNLALRKVLRVRHRCARASATVYELLPHSLDRELLQMILRQSVTHRWWRIFEADSVTGVLNDGAKGYYPHGAGTLKYGHTEAMLRRALVDATGLRVDFTQLYEAESDYWNAAIDLEQDLTAKAVWKPSPVVFSPSNPISLHLRFLSVLFANGREVRPLVAALGTAIADGRLKLTEVDLCELVSLAALTGLKLDFRPAFKWKIGESVKQYVGIVDLLNPNELPIANKICGDVFKDVYGLDGVTAPAFNLLATLVNAFSKPTATRIKQHVRAFCPNASYRSNYRSFGVQRIVDRRNLQFKRFAYLLAGARLEAAIEPENFLDNLGEAVWSLTKGLRKEIVVAEAAMMLRSAERAVDAGYPTLAGALLATFGWALPAAEKVIAKALAERITSAGGLWFRAFDTGSSEWKRILDALDDRLPKAVAARSPASSKVRSGRIVWELGILNSGNENLYCDLVTARYRGPRAPEDGTGDRTITFKSLYGGKYDDCLAERDRAVVAAFNKAGYLGIRMTREVPAAALEAMCGGDNVVLLEDDDADDRPSVAAIELLRQDIPVVGTPGENGSMRLTVPEWCVGINGNYVIRRLSERQFAYYPCGREVRSVTEVFRDFGEGGVISFPKEALEPMRPVLGRLASVLPLQGALSEVAGASGLQRITGEVTPLVRLALEEMRLHLSLKVRPIPSAANVLFEPGVGQAERTLKLAKGPVILVRDLAKEKSAAAVVEQALAEFEGERDAAGEWQIDEATSALEALAAVHALGKSAQVEWLPGKQLAMARPVAKPKVEAALGADEWFAVSGEWQLDDGRLISFAKLLENFDRRVGRFVPIDEKGYLALSRALLRQLEALRTAGQVRKDTLAVSPAALPMLDSAFAAEGADGFALPKAMTVAAERIREIFASLPAMPTDFKGTMRPYQEDGYRWLSRLYDCGIGACLADDMGLGKTIQLIALLAAKKSRGTSLVVAPASVAFNWRNELGRFAPALRVTLVGQIAGAADEDVAALAKVSDVVVTSYGVAASRIESFSSVQWNIVILDEAQAIKNHLTQRAKSVKELKAHFRVAATGTPIENRLTELWSIFDFINPGMLGGEARFTKELAPHGEASPRLKRLVKPLILRRIKREVLTDLPEKEEITVPVVLGDEERHAYEATRLRALAKLAGEDKSNKIAILAELTRLRRFCCHPSLVLPSVTESAKLDALERLLAGLKENGHRALVFSQFVDYLAIVRDLLRRNGWTHEYLDGATPKAERERSVARFQGGQGDFFLISLKAGGMGLNLTAANYVILLDPWWNPAVENQAADRVHRIGQRLPVTVYRLITQDTIEEKVVNLHAKKTALAEDVLESGAASLSADAMLDLLGA